MKRNRCKYAKEWQNGILYNTRAWLPCGRIVLVSIVREHKMRWWINTKGESKGIQGKWFCWFICVRHFRLVLQLNGSLVVEHEVMERCELRTSTLMWNFAPFRALWDNPLDLLRRFISVLISAVFELLHCRNICTWWLGTPLRLLKRISLGTMTRNTVVRTS